MRAATLVGRYVLEPGRGGGGLDLGWSAGGNGVLARTTLAAVGFRRSSTSAFTHIPRLDSQVLKPLFPVNSSICAAPSSFLGPRVRIADNFPPFVASLARCCESLEVCLLSVVKRHWLLVYDLTGSDSQVRFSHLMPDP